MGQKDKPEPKKEQKPDIAALTDEAQQVAERALHEKVHTVRDIHLQEVLDSYQDPEKRKAILEAIAAQSKVNGGPVLEFTEGAYGTDAKEFSLNVQRPLLSTKDKIGQALGLIDNPTLYQERNWKDDDDGTFHRLVFWPKRENR